MMTKKLFLVAIALVAATLLSSSTAAAQVVQPTYVRPSKGTPVTVFNFSVSASAPNDLPQSTYSRDSAVFDMSAFSEVLVESTVVQASISTTPARRSWNVPNLGRYIKFNAFVWNRPQGTPSTVGAQKYIRVRVLSSDSPAGPFVAIEGPEAEVTVFGVYTTATGFITEFKLNMTPLPFTTTQYSRPAKGTPFVVFQGTNITTSTVAPAGPVIDMRGFSAVQVTHELSLGDTAATCRYGFRVEIRGSSEPDASAMLSPIQTPNASRVIQTIGTGDESYVVNVPTSWISAKVTILDLLSVGSACSGLRKIVLTPIPNEVASNDYPIKASNSALTLLASAGPTTPGQPSVLSSYARRFRIQVYGAGPAECAVANVGFDCTNATSINDIFPIKLKAPVTFTGTGVATTGLDGGTAEFDSWSPYQFLCCRAPPGGAETKVGVFFSY